MNPSIEIIYFVMLKGSGEIDITGMPSNLKEKYYDLLEEMSVDMNRFFQIQQNCFFKLDY